MEERNIKRSAHEAAVCLHRGMKALGKSSVCLSEKDLPNFVYSVPTKLASIFLLSFRAKSRGSDLISILENKAPHSIVYVHPFDPRRKSISKTCITKYFYSTINILKKLLARGEGKIAFHGKRS